MRNEIVDLIEEVSGEEAPPTALCYTEETPAAVFESDFVKDVIAVREGEVIKVGYLVLDESFGGHISNYWKEFDVGEMREFGSEAERDEYVEEVEDEGKECVVVDHYEHGRHHFSVTKTQTYLHGRWDTRPSCVFVPSDYYQEQFKEKKESKGEEKARAWLVEEANRVLDTYSDFVNGDIYATVVETWKRTDAYWEGDELETHHVGGYIGIDWAISGLRETMGVEAPAAKDEAAASPGG